MGDESGSNSSSQHPTDQLIRSIVQSGRTPTAYETTQILDHVARAVFGSRPVQVSRRDQGLTYRGITLGKQATPLEYHLVKRVMSPGQEQWVPRTTASEYLDDIRRTAQAATAYLGFFMRDRQHMTIVMAPTEDVLPSHRLGAQALPNLLVIYSADRGTIVTGYQFSHLGALDISGGVQWHVRPRP